MTALTHACVLLGWVLCTASLAAPLRYLQDAHYRPWRLAPRRYLLGQAALLILAVGVVFIWCNVAALRPYSGAAVAVCYLPQAALQLLYWRSTPRCTARLMRLWVLCTAMYFIMAVVSVCFAHLVVAWGIWGALDWLVVQVVATILYPIETGRNRRFVKRQSARLLQAKAVTIGITGSAGKTSVKQLLQCALGDKCFATPGNFNTPMGLALAVRDMPSDTRYFIAEMGAAKVGDLDELLSFVCPAVGVLTCVLPQHTARFGSVEDIRREKSKLLAAASWSVSADPQTRSVDCYLGEGGTYWLDEIVLHKESTSFAICFDGGKIRTSLPLCGRQCAHNALVAYAVAHHLGVLDEDILRRWAQCKRDPHRLCPSTTRRGVIVIDDSYNCNIQGARYALEYLALYEGRKVVATSGVDESDPALCLNEQLGAMLDQACDVVVIVGDRYSRALCKGLATAKVYQVPDTRSSVALYARLLREGDTLLVMADYPQ